MEFNNGRDDTLSAPSSSGSDGMTPSLSPSSTITNGQGSEHEQAKEIFELEWRVLRAEKKNSDLENSVSKNEVVARALRARILELEAVVNQAASDRTIEELTACQQELAKAQEEARKVPRLNDRVARLRQITENLSDERDRLLLKVDEVKAELREAQEQESSVNEIQPDIVAGLEVKIDALTSKNDELTTKHLASDEAAKRSDDAIKFAEAKLRNVEYELRQLQQENSRSEAARASSQSQRLCVAVETNSPDDTIAQRNLQAENIVLKTANANLQQDAINIKDELAHYITKLDIFNAGFRAFDCHHDNYRDMPTHKATNEFRPDRLAHGLFASLCEDDGFIACYKNRRHDYLKHHRLHERANDVGRGVLAWRLKGEFVRLDEQRGVTITYR